MNLWVALIIALILHLLLLLGTDAFPGLRAAWLPDIPEQPPQPEPLNFTFVDLPQEPPEPEKPPENARPSDRTRAVASEPPPEDAPASPDPYAVGNTDQRIDSQPEPEPAPERAQPEQQAEAKPEPKKEAARPFDSPSVAPQEMFPAPPGDEQDKPVEEAEEELEGLDDMIRPFSSRDLGQRFDNSQAASVTDFGPISFDTVGVDWGPYARRIVEIIRARWIERLPPAARMGLKGRSVVSFRIRLDGGVFAIVLEDSSGTRPLDKAAQFAIEASDLPPLPQAFVEMGKDDVGVTFQFYYNMRVPQQ
jgi:TonB family protein